MVIVLNTTTKRTLIVVIVIAIVFFGAVLYETDVLNVSTDKNENILQHENYVLKVGDTSIRVDIADTPLLREQGLSGRKTLADDQGLYFVFDHPGFYQFWMKEMNFPIDIIWIGEHMGVVDITKSASPLSFPQTFVSSVPVSYVLEVKAGFAERHGVNMGDQVVLLNNN